MGQILSKYPKLVGKSVVCKFIDEFFESVGKYYRFICDKSVDKSENINYIIKISKY